MRTASDGDSTLAADLVVLVAVLTAAGIPVAREFCYAIVDPDEYAAVDEALDTLEAVGDDSGAATVHLER